MHAVRPGPRLPLGTLLVRDGLLTAAQLEQALAEKEVSGARLGEIVVARGLISGRALARALAEQHELQYLELTQADVDPAASSLLPEHFARRYHALPIAFEPDSVLVAVADPTDHVASDDLRLALGLPVRFAVCSLMDLEHAISRVYLPQVQTPEEPEEEDEVGGDEIQASDSEPDSAPATMLVNQVLEHALELGASDIHFEAQAETMVVRARVDGVTRKLLEFPRSMQSAVSARLKVMGELEIAERSVPQDGRISVRMHGKPMDLRIAVLPTTHGEQVVLRIMNSLAGPRTLTDLGMSDTAGAAFARALRQPYGAVIACGPTGSGKTTTLYAALDLLNDDGRVLMTIEDPVENELSGVSQIEVNARSGLTFARGLRTILHSDPDVLLVGEIPDEETASIAVQAAMTGRLVLTTLDTHNAASSIAHLKNMGVEPELLAASINCIVTQRLARRLCPHCREAYRPSPEELVELGEFAALDVVLHRAVGCTECAGAGYVGRVAFYEVMEMRGRVRRLMEESPDQIFAAAVEQGMQTLRQDGIRLCLGGVSSLDEIRRVTGDRLL